DATCPSCKVLSCARELCTSSCVVCASRHSRTLPSLQPLLLAFTLPGERSITVSGASLFSELSPSGPHHSCAMILWKFTVAISSWLLGIVTHWAQIFLDVTY